MKNIFGLTLILFFSISLSAQSLDEVFEDGGLSNIHNNVVFSASDFVEGFLTFGYNRYLGERRSLGISLGIFIFNGYPLSLTPGYFNGKTISNLNFSGGYMLHLKYRVYYNELDGFFWQYSFMYRQKTYQNTYFTLSSVPEFKFGYSWIIGTRVNLSASAGFGFGFHGTRNASDRISIWNVDDISWYLPLNVEASYNF